MPYIHRIMIMHINYDPYPNCVRAVPNDDGWLARYGGAMVDHRSGGLVDRPWLTIALTGAPHSKLQTPLNSRWDLNSNSNSILTAGFSLILIEIVPFVRLGLQVVSFWLTDLQLAKECALSNYLWSGNEQKN